MNKAVNKDGMLFCFIILLFISCGLTAYLHKFYFLAIPFLALFVAWTLLHPKTLFYILIAVIPWSAEFSFSTTLSTDLPDEPLMLLVSFLVVAIIVLNRKKYLNDTHWHTVIFILLMQLAWMLISAYFSTNAIISYKQLLAKSWYIIAFVAAPVLFFHNKTDVSRAAIVLAASMLACSFVIVFRHSFNEFTFASVNESVSPFFRNHVNYSALLVCVIPLIFIFMRKADASSRFKKILPVILVICLFALFFSYARGAWLALLIGIAAYWLLKKRLILLAYLFVIIISLSTVLHLKENDAYVRYAHDFNTTVYHQNFEEHLIATYKLKDVSTAERFYRWIAGIRMIKDGWETGFGPGTFYENYKSYTVPAFKTWVSDNRDRSTVHNYFLLIFIEQGIIGLLLFLFLAGYMFCLAQTIYVRTQDNFWKSTVAAITVILAMICTLNFLSDLIETDKVGSIFYLCIGVLIIADIKTRKSNSSTNV
jgi:O-antigen ligase